MYSEGVKEQKEERKKKKKKRKEEEVVKLGAVPLAGHSVKPRGHRNSHQYDWATGLLGYWATKLLGYSAIDALKSSSEIPWGYWCNAEQF